MQQFLKWKYDKLLLVKKNNQFMVYILYHFRTADDVCSSVKLCYYTQCKTKQNLTPLVQSGQADLSLSG